MSHIPNTAMPHAYAENDDDRGIDWRSYLREGRDLARQGLSFVRRHPREAAAGAATLVAGLAFAGWRATRRRRRLAFA